MIPADLTTPIIAASSVAATWLVAILTRKGKREDNRIAEEDQQFRQMSDLAVEYKGERDALRKRVDTADEERRVILDRADQDRQRLIDRELERFDKQVERCRAVTTNLVAVIDELRRTPSGDVAAGQHADEALQALEDHRRRDHDDRLTHD